MFAQNRQSKLDHQFVRIYTQKANDKVIDYVLSLFLPNKR